MGRSIQDWIKSNFVKADFRKFYLVHSWILCPIWTGSSYLEPFIIKYRMSFTKRVLPHDILFWNYGFETSCHNSLVDMRSLAGALLLDLSKTRSSRPQVTGFYMMATRLATLLKKWLWHRCFPVNFAKFSRTFFFNRTLPVAAFKGNKKGALTWKLISPLNRCSSVIYIFISKFEIYLHPGI